MARIRLSFENYFENAFLDAARSGWAEDYDNNVDLFYGRTLIVGPTNADFTTLHDAFDSILANSPTLVLIQTGDYTWEAADPNGVRNKQIVVAPLSGIYGDVILRPTVGNVIRVNYAGQYFFDKIKMIGSTNILDLFDSQIPNVMRVLLNGCYVESTYPTNDSGALIEATNWIAGSTDASGSELSRLGIIGCTLESARSDSGIDLRILTSGNRKCEIRRTVYNYAALNNGSTNPTAYDIEDLSLTETATYGADAQLTMLPIPPQTLGYAIDYDYANPASVIFSNPSAQADLTVIFSENIDLADTHFYEWFREFRDSIRFTDGLGILEVFYETITATDTNSAGKYVTKTIADALSFTVVLKATQSYALREEINLTHDEVTELTTAKIINDSLDIADRLFAQFVEAILEDIHLNETHVNIPQRIMAIYEVMGINDNVHYSAVFARNIAETINILDALNQSKGGTITENIAFSIIALKLVLASILTDICQVTSSATDNVMVTVISNDGLDLSEDFEFNSILKNSIDENIIFTVGIPLDEDQFVTYVINTESKGISEYTNYNFNSISGEYAATNTGIYKLTGDTDDGTAIIGSIKTGLMDFGTSLQKQIPYVYIGCHTDGRIVLNVSTTHKGEKKERWYTMNQTRQAIDTVRIKLGKGIKSTYYQFELVAIDGADFSIDEIELLPLSLKRRI